MFCSLLLLLGSLIAVLSEVMVRSQFVVVGSETYRRTARSQCDVGMLATLRPADLMQLGSIEGLSMTLILVSPTSSLLFPLREVACWFAAPAVVYAVAYFIVEIMLSNQRTEARDHVAHSVHATGVLIGVCRPPPLFQLFA